MNGQPHLRFCTPADIRPELELFVMGLRSALGSAGVDCLIERSSENGSDVAGMARTGEGPGIEFSMTLTDDGCVLVAAEEREETMAISLPGGFIGRREQTARIPLVLFAGAAAFNRRMKMTARTIAEVRRRRRPAVFLACGSLPQELVRLSPPDHYFPLSSGIELQALLGCCHRFLECVDADEPRTPLGRLALSVGLPVILGRSDGGPGTVPVEEWSADAFSEALTAEELSPEGERSETFRVAFAQFKGALGFAES